ncbi:MAG: hypothetical protein AAFY76_15380 [Cyanobacteria bacterium J06649_11]
MKSSIIQSLSRYFFTKDDCFPPNPCREDIGLSKFTELFHYEEYDVCHDVDDLVEILIKMNLDQQYVSMSNETLRVENNIYLVVTYLDRPMIDLAYCLLLNEKSSRRKPELLLFREGTITPIYEALRGNYPHEGIVYQQIFNASMRVSLYGMEEMIVILIKIGNKEEVNIYTEQYEILLDNIKKQGHICYSTGIVENEEQFMKTIQKLRRVDFDTPISLYGAKKYQSRMFELSEGTISYRHKLIFNDVQNNLKTNEILAKVRDSCIIVQHTRYMFMLIKTFVAQNVDQFSRWNNFTKDCNLECRDVYRKTWKCL